MGNILKLSFILGLITCISAGGLSMVNSFTKPLILEQKRLATQRALKIVLPGAANGVYVPFDESELYFAGYKDEAKTEISGYAYKAFGKGYSSTIETLVGVNSEGIVQKTETLFQQETPGLGTKIEGDRFKTQLFGKPVNTLKVDKDGGPIVSITGATISSRTVVNSIRKDYKKFLLALKEFNTKNQEQ